LPQLHHIADRRHAEESFILPVKVRSVAVTNPGAGTGRVETLAEHPPAGFLEVHLLLELQDVGSIATQDGNVTQPVTLLSHQETVDDFPRNQWCEELRSGVL
jgi:hypothetical protein